VAVTPYAEGPGWTIYHGDCRVVMPYLQLSNVGLVVADPPYVATSLRWDRWPTGWVAAVGEAVRTEVPLWCFGSMRMFIEQAQEFEGWSFGQDLVWEKHNGSGFHADRFKRVHEQVVQWYRGRWEEVWKRPVTTPDATARQVRRKARPAHMGAVGDSAYQSTDGGPRLMRSVLRVRSTHGHALVPTQKPVGVIEPLLAYNLAPGGVVLDPTMGSGSTLRAAVDRGYSAIGIEAGEATCEIAATRLQQGALSLEY
jgi:site-specific DNA-methyltransferase (adenine-specific)